MSRFLNDFAAVVGDTPGSQAVVESTVPLRTKDANGREVPVDLHLVPRGAGFEELNSAAPSTLGARVSDGIRLKRSGVSLTPVVTNGDVAPQQVGPGVLYANTDVDTDVIARPEPDGVELAAALRSPASPEHLTYRVGLPAGATATVPSDGTRIDIAQNGQPIASIPAPFATDAESQTVPTSFALNGTDLTVTVSHRAGSYAYPITLDPRLVEHYNWNNGTPTTPWFKYGNNDFVYTAGFCNNMIALCVWGKSSGTYASGDFGAWVYQAPTDVNIFAVDSWTSFNAQSPFEIGSWILGSPGSSINWTGNRNNTWDLRCVQSGCPEVFAGWEGTTGNAYWFYLKALAAGNYSNGVPESWLQAANVYLHDGYSPSVATPTGAGNDGQWHSGGSFGPFPVSATDRGLGLTDVHVDGGSIHLQSQSNCTGDWGTVCPLTEPATGWSPTFTYDTANLPEGTNTLTATAHDVVGNWGTSSWPVKVDRSPPTGSLTGVGAYTRGAITVSGTMSDAWSGPKDWTLQISPSGQNNWQTLCSGQTTVYSCAWNTTSGSYPDGSYDLRALMHDNVSSANGGPNTGYTPTLSTLVDNTPPEQLKEIAPAVGATDYSDEVTDGDITDVTFQQHDATSGVDRTTLEYNTATDGSSSGSWQPANAQPATGDGTASTYWDTSDVSEGLHLVRATTYDNAGNSAQTNWQVDASARKRGCVQSVRGGVYRCYAGFGYGTPTSNGKYLVAYGLRDYLQTPSYTPGGSGFSLGVAGNMYGSTHRSLEVGANSGNGCSNISNTSRKWIMYAQYQTKDGSVQASPCFEQLGTSTKRFYAVTIAGGSCGGSKPQTRVIAEDKHGNRRVRLVVDHRKSVYIGCKGLLVEAYGETSRRGRGIGGAWSSVQYQHAHRSSWDNPDSAHVFNFDSSGAGYHHSGPSSDFCVYGPSRSGC